MTEGSNGLIAALDALFGGAATTILTAMTARLVYHGGEVSKKRRRLFGPEILWEAPIAVVMALIGEAVADYAGLSHSVTIGVIAVLAYMGPRGAQTFAENWWTRGGKK